MNMAAQQVITASLDDWEKALLLEFAQLAPEILAFQDGIDHRMQTAIFNSWFWARKLNDDLDDIATNATARAPAVSTLWDRIRGWISLTKEGYFIPSRLTDLLHDNPLLQAWLLNANGAHDIGNVSVLRNQNDAGHWLTVAGVISFLPLMWQGLKPGEQLHTRFGPHMLLDDLNADKSTKLLVEVVDEDLQEGANSSEDSPPTGSGHDSSTSNAQVLTTGDATMSDSGLQDTLGQLRHERIHGKLSGPGPNQEPWSPPLRDLQRQESFARHSVHDSMALLESLKSELRLDNDPQDSSVLVDDNTTEKTYRVYEIWSLLRMAAMTLRRARRQPLPREPPLTLAYLLPHSCDDPGRVLEFIPLDELAIDGSISAGAEVVWKPAVQWSLDHHLFTEEEVFKYCVEANYTFPQHFSASSVVFIAKHLETSPILRELDKLESLWNDCAVTVDPKSRQWYLLETRPGVQFRKLSTDFSTYKARDAFRQAADRHRLQKSHRLKDTVVGLPKLKRLAEYGEYDPFEAILCSEIASFQDEALGGQSGDVFRAQWVCPRKLNMETQKTYNVILKRVWPERPGSRSTTRLIRELELTLEVSARGPSASSMIYGLTRMPRRLCHAEVPESEKAHMDKPDNIFIVFEFAKISLERHLGDALIGLDQDWQTMSYLFQDLAYSIGAIHNKNIVHRDLHLGNIMIREETFYRSTTSLSGDQLVIIDLGESRTVRSLPDSINAYGDREFWAPELKSSSWSKASDMYAIGRVMFKMLELRCTLSNTQRVPAPLGRAAKSCLPVDPVKRATVDQLLARLNRVIWQHFAPAPMQAGAGTITFTDDWILLADVPTDDMVDSDSDAWSDSQNDAHD